MTREGTKTCQQHKTLSRLSGVLTSTLMLLVMCVPFYYRQGTGAFLGTSLLLTFLAWLPLTLRKRLPTGTAVAAVATESAHLVVFPFAAPGVPAADGMAAYQPVPLATMFALYSFASRTRQAVGWASGVGAAVVLVITALLFQPLGLLATNMMMFNLVLLATAAGIYRGNQKSRAARMEKDRREDIRRNVIEERMRIARELHDVLAHNLTLVNAQAGVAAYLLKSNPAAAETALNNISEHTRAALDEVRSTVGLLRQNIDADTSAGDQSNSEELVPTPGLANLDALLAGFRRAGNSVELKVTGTKQRLTPLADLAAYRIVQEALTNAVKHAPGIPVVVATTWTARTLSLRVCNEAPIQPAKSHRPPGSGHGLIGMRERALTAMGTFRAGPTRAGGFRVEATFPVTAPVSTARQGVPQ